MKNYRQKAILHYRSHHGTGFIITSKWTIWQIILLIMKTIFCRSRRYCVFPIWLTGRNGFMITLRCCGNIWIRFVRYISSSLISDRINPCRYWLLLQPFFCRLHWWRDGMGEFCKYARAGLSVFISDCNMYLYRNYYGEIILFKKKKWFWNYLDIRNHYVVLSH